MDKLILSEDEIQRICQRLASEIDDKISESGNGIPVILGIMNGGLPFMFELIKRLKHPIQVDTIRVASYDGTSSSGVVKVLKEPDLNLQNRDVYLVEDIIDTGVTMHFLKEYIYKAYKPKNLYTCVLIKRQGLKVVYDEQAEFTGLCTDEQRFIVGFGFDYYGLFRNEPYVFVPSIKDIEEWNKLLNEDSKAHPDLTE